ncbi:MAG: helix-turn-helix domain-containing protein [Opitutaceae bacterium]
MAPSQTGGDADASSFGLREQNLRFILGLKLHNLRQERGLSLVQLSNGCGLSISYLNEIEKGKKYPKTDKLLALAEALGVTYNELVSADPGEKLRPIAALLSTRMMDDLPLAHYGISPPVLMEIMAAGPDRLGAMLAFFAKLASRFSFSVDDLLRAAVRDDLEANNYHLPELEDRAVSLAAEIGWQAGQAPILSQLRFSLQHDSGWEIDEQKLDEFPDLAGVEAVPMASPQQRRLFLNPALPDGRKAFLIAREIAATALGHYHKIRKRASATEKGFRQLQAAAQASYLGGALLMPRQKFVEDLRKLFEETSWKDEHLLDLVARYGGDAEVVLHRIIQLLPDLGISSRYLTRTETSGNGSQPGANREIRLGSLPEIDGAELAPHKTRATAATRLLAEALDHPASARATAAIEGDSKSGGRFLVLAVAQPRALHPKEVSVSSLGILLDEASRNTIKFAGDPALADHGQADAEAAIDTPGASAKARRHAALTAFHNAMNR